MGQKKSRHSSGSVLDQVILRRITSATSFLPDEIHYFYYDFLKYTPTGYLILADFEKFYQTLFQHGVTQKFAKYVFDAYDTNRDEVVDFEEFIMGLYYTTKALPAEKIRWAFDLCDQGKHPMTKNYSLLYFIHLSFSSDRDQQLNATELENIIQALYEVSEAHMARAETYEVTIDRVKQLFLIDQDGDTNKEILTGVTRERFIDIVLKDKGIVKLLDCRPVVDKGASKSDHSTTSLFKKQLKFQKSLSDSTLATTNAIKE